MFTGSTKLPPTKTPQPERLDEVYAALRRGLQWVNTPQAQFALIQWMTVVWNITNEAGYDCFWVRKWRTNSYGCHCQVISTGPPAGAGQSGSADQRKQEEWSFGESSCSQTSHTSIDCQSATDWLLLSSVLSQDVNLTLCDAKWFFFSGCLLCRGLCMSWIRWVSFTPVSAKHWNCIKEKERPRSPL